MGADCNDCRIPEAARGGGGVVKEAEPTSDTRDFCSGTTGSFFLAVPEMAPGSVFTDSDSLPSPVPAGRKGLSAVQTL